MKRQLQKANFHENLRDEKMNQINIKGVGLLNEEQISNLITNARRLRRENEVLKQEIDALKEVSL